MLKRKNTPKIQVFCLPQFKDPYVIIELKGKIYRGFYSKPKNRKRKRALMKFTLSDVDRTFKEEIHLHTIEDLINLIEKEGSLFITKSEDKKTNYEITIGGEWVE